MVGVAVEQRLYSDHVTNKMNCVSIPNVLAFLVGLDLGKSPSRMRMLALAYGL